ncbi:tripartite motif-containing protein 16 isoform X2 [Astyanax mexicanus]|uniref:tripartite motif-containing protein 16 isoform X2 n=1 Tax=Astyanax mexicanus TaxID=7994 RepID=UPI0020CAC32A|nr:tripartite motif-containing protein 16 isoform X2 [Astyanax mexicanus]
MAEAAVKYLDSFSCPICLDLLKDPVTIPCGHSFCLGCIKDCWAGDDQRKVYSCPQCRHTFTPRPVLNKNTMLAELSEGLRKTRLQAALPSADSPAGSGGVECDVCTGTKHTAVKSCLVCLASFCEAHIQPHYEVPAYKKHKLVEASMNLQEKICSLHDKLLEVFCRTDQQCICLLCVMDEHSGHKTVSAAAERAEKQKQLVETQRKSQQRIQQTEKKLQELRQTMETLRRSAQAAVEDSEKIFTELIQSMERRRSEVKELIRAQEKTELSLAEDLLKKLEQQIADLRRRDAELEKLLHSEDPVHFLQSFQSLSAPPQSADLPQIPVSPQFSMEELKKAVTGVMERVEPKLLRFSGGFISSSMTAAPLQKPQQLLQSPEPKTREDFLKYSCQLTLDPNTAHTLLALSERNRKATVMRQNQQYPDHPERFDTVRQVLCRESLSGRCYWEVEFRISFVEIAVCYKNISRKGGNNESRFGSNDQSWNLICDGSSFYFRHNNKETELPVVSSSSRIGVYVDHSAGILSFYSVSDTMTLLHRVHTTFTQPLYPGFRVYEYGNDLQISDLNYSSNIN